MYQVFVDWFSSLMPDVAAIAFLLTLGRLGFNILVRVTTGSMGSRDRWL